MGARFRFPSAEQDNVDFDQVFDDLFPSLYRYCHRLTGDPDTAEDVAQESFVRMVRNDVEGPVEAVRVWLFKVATHLVRDRWRVSENRRRLLEANPDPVSPSTSRDPERDAERSETVAEVRRVLDGLAERDRRLLLMREEGFSYKEMAEAVGVKPTSIGTLLARAQERFVNAYQEHAAPEGVASEDHDQSR